MLSEQTKDEKSVAKRQRRNGVMQEEQSITKTSEEKSRRSAICSSTDSFEDERRTVRVLYKRF
jgi:DNA topoisomerase VI subunit A